MKLGVQEHDDVVLGLIELMLRRRPTTAAAAAAAEDAARDPMLEMSMKLIATSKTMERRPADVLQRFVHVCISRGSTPHAIEAIKLAQQRGVTPPVECFNEVCCIRVPRCHLPCMHQHLHCISRVVLLQLLRSQKTPGFETTQLYLQLMQSCGVKPGKSFHIISQLHWNTCTDWLGLLQAFVVADARTLTGLVKVYIQNVPDAHGIADFLKSMSTHLRVPLTSNTLGYAACNAARLGNTAEVQQLLGMLPTDPAATSTAREEPRWYYALRRFGVPESILQPGSASQLA